MKQNEIDSLVTALSLWTTIDGSPEDELQEWQPVKEKAGEQVQQLVTQALAEGTNACTLIKEIITNLGVAGIVQKASATRIEQEYLNRHHNT